MKIGMVVASLSRLGGGVSQSVRDLTNSLSLKGVDVEVFAGLDNYSEEDSLGWCASKVHLLPVTGPAAFGYQSGLVKLLMSSKLDCIHQHGLWMYESVAVSRVGSLGLPVVLSPHGMLDSWALRNSAWKKRMAWVLYERRNVLGATTLHALNSAEANAFRSLGLTNSIECVPNGVARTLCPSSTKVAVWEEGLPAGARWLLFLGRLHPKKGLYELIEGFSLIADRQDIYNWNLMVAGWDDGGYLSQLQDLVDSRSLSERVRFIGPVFGDSKVRAFEVADGFILPSFSEGLPIAVLEAWAAGVPTIISPQCNIDLAFTRGASLSASPDAVSISEAIVALANMSEVDRQNMVEEGQKLISFEFSWDRIADRMISVYRGAIEARSFIC